MDIVRPILALTLLVALAWIAGYVVCLKLLTGSLWAPRLHLQDRFPPARFKKINRVVSTLVGLIMAAIAVYYCIPAIFENF